jgi:hypothetical protein
VVVPSALDGIVTTSDGPSLQCSSASVNIPEIAVTPNGYNCEPLHDLFQVRWLVEGDKIAVELVGVIGEEDYMGFGISGSNTSTSMTGADVVVADTFEGTFRAQDYFLNERSQCTGSFGVCPGNAGSFDEVNATTVNGERDQGVTLIRYTKALNSILVAPGETTFVAWAVGPLSPDTGYPQFHLSYPKQNVSIDFGRSVTDNCQPLLDSGAATEAPKPLLPFEVPILQNATDINATIGPSGGTID